MKIYKLKLKHEEIKFFYSSLKSILDHSSFNPTSKSISYITYYNIKSLLKRLHDKLFHLSNLIRVRKETKYILTVDINEYKALIELYVENKKHLDNPYLLVLYSDIITQIDKQELALKDKYTFENPPVNVDVYKYKIDYNKNV